MPDHHNAGHASIARRDVMFASAGFATLFATLAAGETALAQTPPNQPAAQSAPPGTVDVERRGSVLLIGINRPQAQNRFDPPIIIGIGKAYYQLDHDDGLRAAVLHGIGPNFSAGVDLPAFLAGLKSGVLPPKDPDFINPFGLRPPFRTKPVVVAAQGATQLGAHELFLACDIRVATTDAVFRQHEVVRGVFPGGGGTVRMTREAGWANAMRYLLTGDEWGAEEARRLSLVQEITPPGKQLDRAIELAQKIAAAAPLGVSATLATAHQAISSEEAALQGLLPEFQKITQSEDAQEAQRAFSGRPPARVPRAVSRRGYCDLATPLRLTKAGMAVVVAAASVNGGAMEHGYAQTLVTHRIPAALAMEAVEAAVAACAGQGYGVTATVIDADAERIAVLRGDTAGVHTFEASWGKAYTAVGFAPIFKLDSGGEVAERVAQFSARQLAGTLPFQPPESMIFRAGGLTIKLGDEVLGAIGVGGAPTAQADEACARAGLDKIRDRLR